MPGLKAVTVAAHCASPPPHLPPHDDSGEVHFLHGYPGICFCPITMQQQSDGMAKIKRSSVCIYKTYEARHPSITCWDSLLVSALEDPAFWSVFVHLNFHTPSRNYLVFHSPNSLLSLSPPFLSSSLWCQPPGLLDQRAFLWDHLERPGEVEEGEERGKTTARKEQRGKKWMPGIVEKKFLCQGRLVFRLTCSRGTQFAPPPTHTQIRPFHLAADTTITFDLSVLGGLCQRS